MIKVSLQTKASPLILTLVLAINAIFLRAAMYGQFDPGDNGSFMDLSWRILCGQKLYVDVITHVQPLFPHIMALFFKLFGYGRHGALAHMVISSSAMIFLVYAIARRLPVYAVAVVLALTMIGFYWNYPFPNYNQDGFLFGMPGVWALSSQIPFATKRSAFRTALLCGFFAVLSAMIKINIGVIYGAVFAGTLILGPFKKESLAGFTAGGLAGIAFTLPMTGDLREFLSQNYLYARNQAIRGHHSHVFLVLKNWQVNGYWIPVTLVLLHLGKDVRKLLQRTALFTGIFFVAVIHYYTSSMFIKAHIPLMGTLVGLGWLLLEEVRDNAGTGAALKGIRRFTVPALIVFSVFQMVQSAAFSSQIAFGKAHPNPDLHREYVIKTEPLTGWQSPQALGEAFDQVSIYLNQSVPKKDSLLILAPLYPLYAMTGRQSYRGISYDFKIENMPAPGAHVQRVKKVILNNPPDWLLTYKDESPFPINAQLAYMEIQGFILAHYKIEKSWGPIGLLKKVR